MLAYACATDPAPRKRLKVTLLRDERLTVEKSVWSLKSELEAFSARRSDAIRSERRRGREEGALEARREALASAVAREEERMGLSKTKREKLVAEVRERGIEVAYLNTMVLVFIQYGDMDDRDTYVRLTRRGSQVTRV